MRSKNKYRTNKEDDMVIGATMMRSEEGGKSTGVETQLVKRVE